MEQVVNSTRLQRIKLYSKLDIQLEDVNHNREISSDCCDFDLNDSEKDLELVDTCFENASELTICEKSALYYIYGYVCNKEGIVCQDAIEESNTLHLPK